MIELGEKVMNIECAKYQAIKIYARKMIRDKSSDDKR